MQRLIAQPSQPRQRLAQAILASSGERPMDTRPLVEWPIAISIGCRPLGVVHGPNSARRRMGAQARRWTRFRCSGFDFGRGFDVRCLPTRSWSDFVPGPRRSAPFFRLGPILHILPASDFGRGPDFGGPDALRLIGSRPSSPNRLHGQHRGREDSVSPESEP